MWWLLFPVTYIIDLRSITMLLNLLVERFLTQEKKTLLHV